MWQRLSADERIPFEQSYADKKLSTALKQLEIVYTLKGGEPMKDEDESNEPDV